jgi:hypothetical protein
MFSISVFNLFDVSPECRLKRCRYDEKNTVNIKIKLNQLSYYKSKLLDIE